ncbi:ribonuclease G, partial [Escherichia coli]
PTRHYQAFAAWRLAKLVARIRELHRDIFERDCPITVVCHSQGNMVGLASAYFGANHREFQSLGVADTYVLANPPYSLRGSRLDNFSQFDGAGRVTYDARVAGLKGFFNIVRHFQARAQHYSHHAVDQLGFNACPQNGDTPRTAAQD